MPVHEHNKRALLFTTISLTDVKGQNDASQFEFKLEGEQSVDLTDPRLGNESTVSEPAR